jgi:hypothetical protein
MAMSWLKSILGLEESPIAAPEREPEASATVLLLGDEQFAFQIVGESHYQEWLETIAGPKCEEGCEKEVAVELRAEPRNPFDANAIQVLILDGVVGYIPRPAAAVLAPMLSEMGAPPAKAAALGVIAGGWLRPGSEGSYGVRLDLRWPPQAGARPG